MESIHPSFVHKNLRNHAVPLLRMLSKEVEYKYGVRIITIGKFMVAVVNFVTPRAQVHEIY